MNVRNRVVSGLRIERELYCTALTCKAPTRIPPVNSRRNIAPMSQAGQEGDDPGGLHSMPIPDQTTSISHEHLSRKVICESGECFHTKTKTKLTIAGASRNQDAKYGSSNRRIF